MLSHVVEILLILDPS